MRRFLLIFLLSLSALFAVGPGLSARETVRTDRDTTELDAASKAQIDSILTIYLSALERESVETKISETDFMLSACQTDRVLDYVAGKLYAHYIDSPVMGDESVAIHLLDKWFLPGKAKFATELELFNARIYADFNRASLLGSRAPALRLQGPDGKWTDVLGNAPGDSLAAPSDRLRVLYFYSPDCVKCRVETPLLVNMLADKDFAVDLIAVDSDDNRAEWDEWRGKFSALENSSSVRVSHYWDPSLDSDYQRKYGVLQTPRMFLVDTTGIITGRGLDVSALEKMLSSAFGVLTYGSQDSERFFDALFSSSTDSTGGYVGTARYLASRLEGRPLLYRQYIGDMLYYLNGRPGRGAKETLLYTADSLVLARPDIWTTHDDSLKVVGLAEIASDMLGRAPEGKKVPALRLPGELLSVRHPALSGKEKMRQLRKLPGRQTYIMFYTEGCHNCEAEKEGIRKMFTGSALDRKIRQTRVFMVDLDLLSPDLRSEALDAFDLSNLPYITLTSADGTVLGRWLTFATE